MPAQVTGATLQGVISDAQGRSIPNAKVTLTDIGTGIAQNTTSNAAGVYNFANVNPSNYQLIAIATGFSRSVTTVTLSVGAIQTQNLSLKVGEAQQTVEVTAAPPQLNTTSATLSTVVEQHAIVSLPLNGRDWASLATLQPGVESVRTQEVVTQPGGNLRGLGMQMTISGARPTQNVYRLDGVIVNDYSNAGPGNVLGENVGVDAVQEFSVMTSNYSAQYGYTSGGVINAITKSGTNQFHGSAYEFIRNSALDAANFFENFNNIKKGVFRRNQFGVSLGGPMKKNKIFIFANYEGLRQSTAIPLRGKVLTPNARLGIIEGATVPLSYGATRLPVDANGNTVPWTGPCPFPNMTNLAPGRATICVDNTMAKLVNEMDPAPNGPSQLNANIANRTFDAQEPVTDNFLTFRSDINISTKDTFHASYYQDHSNWEKPSALNTSISAQQVPHEAISFEETHIFTPNLINTMRLGYNRSNLLSPTVANLLPASTDTSFGILPGLPAPGVSAASIGGGGGGGAPSGFGGFSGSNGFEQWTGMAQLFDDASYTTGNHSISFGAMALRDHDNMINSGAPINGGSVGFASTSDLLQNLPNSVRMPTVDPFTPGGNTIHHYRAWVLAGYLLDDWHVSSNFSLNLGVRYEMEPIMKETDNKVISLKFLWSNPTGCTYSSSGVISGCANLRTKIFTKNPTTNNIEPRLGFSWDPWGNGKTAVRGGFGVFDVLPMPYMIGLNPLQTAPAGPEVDLSQPPQGGYGAQVPAGGLSRCTASNPSFACQALTAGVGTTAQRWAYIDPTPKRNYVSQWNVNIQRQLSSNTAITVAYAGSRTFHNVYQTDTPNIVMPYHTSAGWLEPNPVGSGCLPSPAALCSATDVALGLPSNFSANPTGIVPGLLINPYPALIQSELWTSEAWYDGLQANLTRRMSNNLSFQFSYTWQKSIDTTSGSFAGDNFAADVTPTIPWWDNSMIKGPSDFNVGHSLVANVLWNAPGNSLKGPAAVVAKGWQLGGIVTVSDGVPLWPLGGLEGDAMGQFNNEPYLIPSLAKGCTAQNVVQPGNVQYLKPDCFIPAQAPSLAFYNAPEPLGCDKSFAYPTCINLYGNLGRNAITGPGEFNMDFSLSKDFAISSVSEGFHAQFRAEFFNVLNHPNFQAPVNNLESIAPDGTVEPGFGQIDATLTPGREVQFGLKLLW
ncbi:MAG TPA: carboxypeptidase regulatory-like domain-containing protein [Terriglobales bacterium]